MEQTAQTIAKIQQIEHTQQVEKPVTIIIDEFENGIIEKINESHLPYIVIESVMEKILNSVKAAAIKQLQADKDNYNKALEQVNAKQNDAE